MLPRTPKHEFMAELHEHLRPRRYLEIGVQTGTSLYLTRPDCMAIGVDPNPMCEPPPNATIFPVTADKFFAEVPAHVLADPVDMAFVDGMHLVEYALRDVINCEERSHMGGIILVDDVLPYSADIAVRTPLQGDWTGDVWKLWPILTKWRPDLKITMVDVEPTGLMVIQELSPVNGVPLLRAYYDQICETWTKEYPLDQWVSDGNMLGRVGTYKPEAALARILNAKEA